MSTDTIKITLTDRRPVVVSKTTWPILARANGDSYSSSDYARHQQALSRGEVDLYWLTARQHADGRTLVYAVFDAATAWTGSEDRREGDLLEPGDDVARALRSVGERCGLPDAIIREAIASLPAEQL